MSVCFVFFEVNLFAQHSRHTEEKQHVCWRGLGFLSRKKYVGQVMKGKTKIIKNTAPLTPWGSLLPQGSTDSAWGSRGMESGSSSKCFDMAG